MRHVHEKLKPFECHLCEMKFSQQISLQAHVETVHGKLKPFECKICEKRFGIANRLKIHVREIHSDLRILQSKQSKLKRCETLRKNK